MKTDDRDRILRWPLKSRRFSRGLAWLLGGWLAVGSFVSGMKAKTVVEPKTVVPNIYLDLPEELVRLRDPALAEKPETSLIWKTGLPVTLEAKVAGQQGTVVCDTPYDKWPALLDEAVGKLVGGRPTAVQDGSLSSILSGKVDFWSLVQSLEAPAAPDREVSLSGTDALHLADRLLLLAVETALNFDPQCYRLTARAVALANYAARVDPALLPAANVRLAVALRLQGESALAIELCRSTPSDPVSQGWAYYVLQFATDLAKLNSDKQSEFLRKLRVLALRANGRSAEEVWQDLYSKNADDVWAFAHLVGEGSISVARSHDEALLQTFFRVETQQLAGWASRLDSSFNPQIKGPSWFFSSEGRAEFFKAQVREITEGQEALLARIPAAPVSTSWRLGTDELKALVRGRREAVFWQKLRLYIGIWGVPEALPMATAWNQAAPRSPLAHVALHRAILSFGTPKMSAPELPDEPIRRTLLTRAMVEMTGTGYLNHFPLKQWAEEQPAEIELLMVHAQDRARAQPSGDPPLALARLLERHPMACPEFHLAQIDRHGGSAAREKFLAALDKAADIMPESGRMCLIAAQAHCDFKRDIERTLGFCERYRQIAPEGEAGYSLAASLLLSREQPKEALAILDSSNHQVTEVLSRASVDGWRARCLMELGQTNEAIRVSRDAARTYSGTSLHNFADILMKAGRRVEAVQVSDNHWERYRNLTLDPQLPQLLCLNEAAGLRQKIYAQMRSGWREIGTMSRVLEILDENGLLEEISPDIIPADQLNWLTCPYISALLRKEGKWEEARRVLAIGGQVYANWPPTNFDLYRYRIQLESDRVGAKTGSLSSAKEEGFLVEGHSIGPFRNWFGEGYGTAYPPETEFDLSKSYPGIDGAICRWRPWKGGGIRPLWRPREYAFDTFPIWCVYYLRCEVVSDHEVTRELWYASQGGYTGVSLNGKWIVPAAPPRWLTPNTVQVTLQKGENAFLFKVCAAGITSDLIARLR